MLAWVTCSASVDKYQAVIKRQTSPDVFAALFLSLTKQDYWNMYGLIFYPYSLHSSTNSWPRWSTAVATWRSVSTAWTCLRLTAAIRTWDWWLSAIHCHPALLLRSNCTATCSCSEPAWTWSSSSSTHGTFCIMQCFDHDRLEFQWFLSFFCDSMSGTQATLS